MQDAFFAAVISLQIVCMNCVQAKKMDLVEYLSALGYRPKKIKGAGYWYISPFREEKLASFKVDRKKNLWYDHGMGKGGNLIDFATLFHHCSVREFLEKLSGNFSFHPPHKKDLHEEPSPLKILSVKELNFLPLLRYVSERRIHLETAKKYCKEIHFSVHEKIYSTIGFPNDSGGYELRNEWFKGSSSPKAITTIKNQSKQLHVFEGFFDFLSYRTIFKNEQTKTNFLILNSISFFEKSRAFMEQHDSIRLFLDHDQRGEELTKLALSWHTKYKDESKVYKGYKDLNDWCLHIGRSQKRQTTI